MLGKLKSMIGVLRDTVFNFYPPKGLMLAITGDLAASNPIIVTSYNVVSIIRTGVGFYRITASQGTIFGVPLSSNSIITVSHTIQPTVVSEAHFVRLIRVSAIEFDLEVTEMTVGGGNKLEVSPYDILTGDGVDISFLLNLGTGKLPPE